jgi:hypothetical protein
LQKSLRKDNEIVIYFHGKKIAEEILGYECLDVDEN